MVRVTLRMAKGKNIKGSPEHNRMNAWGYVKTVESIARSSLCKLLTIPPHKLLLTYEDRNYVLRTLLLPLLPRCTTAAMNAYKPMGKDWKKKIYTRNRLRCPLCPLCRKGKKKKKKNHIMKNVRRVYFANCSFTFYEHASLFDTCIIWRKDHLIDVCDRGNLQLG